MYAELHCLSAFTFLRGASMPDRLVERAAELGYEALAITDECSFAGVVRAHVAVRTLRARGRPAPRLILGTELRLDDDARLVLLATDGESYRRISMLISAARRCAPKGEYRVDEAMIEAAGLDGVIALLVPPYGPMHREALEWRFGWVGSIGRRAGIALELHSGQQDLRHRLWLEEMAMRHGLPLVAAGDVHMARRGDRALQDVLTCVRHRRTLADVGRRLHANGEHHLRGLDELAVVYPEEARHAAVTLSRLCDVDLDRRPHRLPRECVPPGRDPNTVLAEHVESGAARRWPAGTPQAVSDQLARELEVLGDLGYAPYLLAVADIVAFATGRGILCQGRGSAANSAVCFCLGITSVDPATSRLVFERFVSRERKEVPDIDVDFEHERREEVFDYVYRRYGRARAALTATVVRFRTRAAVRELASVFGIAPDVAARLARALARRGPEDASPVGDEVRTTERVVAEGLDPAERTLRRVLWLVPQLVDHPRHLSQHAGGFVLSDGPLAELVPLENAAMPGRTVIQWDKDDLEALGLMKLDLLALGALGAIRKSFEAVAAHRGVAPCPASIPADDAPTYDMLCRADSIGVFQVESRAQMAMLPKLRPRCWYDLVVQVALVRPGPIQGGMVHPYLAAREAPEAVRYPVEALRPVLERTLGVPVFQEQVMEILVILAGYTGGEADRLRSAMKRWRAAGEMERFRAPVLARLLARGHDERFAERLLDQLEGFGEYGFPESHAASFARIVYVSAWLKCHEPAAYLVGLLNSQPMGFYGPSQLVQHARRAGVDVLPVDVRASDVDHRLLDPGPADAGVAVDAVRSVRRGAIRLGLRLVSGLGQEAAGRIVEARRVAPFGSLEDLVERAGLDARARSALAASGALPGISGHRHRSVWAVLGIERRAPDLLDGVGPLGEEPVAALRAPTLGEDAIADYDSLGLTLGPHPMSLLRAALDEAAWTDSARWRAESANGDRAHLAGFVVMRQRPGSAHGTLFVSLEDEHGTIELICWPAVVERHRRAAQGARLLGARGRTQRDRGALVLIVDALEDLEAMLARLPGMDAAGHGAVGGRRGRTTPKRERPEPTPECGS